MTRPAPPGLGHGIAVVFRLQWKRLIRGRKLRLGVLSLLLVVVAAGAARHLGSDADPAEVMDATARWGFFSLLVFLVSFLFHAGAVAEEVEARTFTYLAGRPAGRLAITLGKYLAGTAMSLALLVGGLLATHAILFATDPGALMEGLPSTLKLAGALALLALYYGALCLFWGSLAPQAAGIIATLHLAALEFVFTWAPGVVRLLSMNHMARVLGGVELGGLMVGHVPPVGPGAAAAVLTVMAAVAVTASALVVGMSEYRDARA
jgi:ABC-type transport system involved in multi-copper enzyme maturation permease subunit